MRVFIGRLVLGWIEGILDIHIRSIDRLLWLKLRIGIALRGFIVVVSWGCIWFWIVVIFMLISVRRHSMLIVFFCIIIRQSSIFLIKSTIVKPAIWGVQFVLPILLYPSFLIISIVSAPVVSSFLIRVMTNKLFRSIISFNLFSWIGTAIWIIFVIIFSISTSLVSSVSWVGIILSRGIFWFTALSWTT